VAQRRIPRQGSRAGDPERARERQVACGCGCERQPHRRATPGRDRVSYMQWAAAVTHCAESIAFAEAGVQPFEILQHSTKSMFEQWVWVLSAHDGECAVLSSVGAPSHQSYHTLLESRQRALLRCRLVPQAPVWARLGDWNFPVPPSWPRGTGSVRGLFLIRIVRKQVSLSFSAERTRDRERRGSEIVMVRKPGDVSCDFSSLLVWGQSGGRLNRNRNFADPPCSRGRHAAKCIC
jgi:hypothetical protein